MLYTDPMPSRGALNGHRIRSSCLLQASTRRWLGRPVAPGSIGHAYRVRQSYLVAPKSLLWRGTPLAVGQVYTNRGPPCVPSNLEHQ